MGCCTPDSEGVVAGGRDNGIGAGEQNATDLSEGEKLSVTV